MPVCPNGKLCLLNQTIAVFFVEIFLVKTFSTGTFLLEPCIDLVELYVDFIESRFHFVGSCVDHFGEEVA